MADTIRSPLRLTPDPARLVARPFIPGSTNFAGSPSRLERILKRILDVPGEARTKILDETGTRHSDAVNDLQGIWLQHFAIAQAASTLLDEVADPDLRLFVGACLTQLYAYEGAAVTNPSMVPLGDPDSGRQRFVLSTRAVGEGHVSSIGFLTGSVGPEGELALDLRSKHVSNGVRAAPAYSRESFRDKLVELGFLTPPAERILEHLGDSFDTVELDTALRSTADTDFTGVELDDAVKRVHWLAASNYRLDFDAATPISEHLISPAAPAESHGLEDARFVRFVDDDGSERYYGTYTAYDGVAILPQLIETPDFHSFRMATMTGPAVHHKGMALFPRRVDGELLALSRHDNESTFLLRGDSFRRWTSAELIFGPEREWEIIQTGNCGSPLETDWGWLVITHGVGPMRRYVLGAVLLDIDEPSKVIGRLSEPWLEPAEDERHGYVPNVVYSCGSMIHDGALITPYGYSDVGIGFAITTVESLIADMV
jgi:predicted GH43/DUF377 family glycosyl hydrolase